MSGTNSQKSGRARAGVVGATGLAGQQFLDALVDHPQLEVVRVAASERSAGKTYRDAITGDDGQLRWYADSPLDTGIAALMVEDARAMSVADLDVVFTCIDSGPARELEPVYAKDCAVISTASAFRYDDDVPVILPGVNMDHIPLLQKQQQTRGWKGFISPNPNCTTVGLAMTLAPLYRAFGIDSVHMVSMQAVSGAGRSGGVIALDAIDNIIPYIPNEEGKVEVETLKILGDVDGDIIRPASFPISSTCTRVGVLEGHTEVVHLRLSRDVDLDDIVAAWRDHGSDFIDSGYPSSPDELIFVHDDPYRPQVRLDRDRGDGLTTSVGRLRRDDNVPNGWKYMLVAHNTKLGAAKGCILLAEHLLANGIIAR